MVLKKKIVKLSDIEIEIQELSFAGQLRLESLEKISMIDFYKECISEENLKSLEDIGKEDGKILRDAFDQLNGWKEESPIK